MFIPHFISSKIRDKNFFLSLHPIEKKPVKKTQNIFHR